MQFFKMKKNWLAMICAVLCFCAGFGGVFALSSPTAAADAQTTLITPTEVKASSTFDENGVYTANYEINITFSAPFATCGDGNAAPTLYSELSAKLTVGGKSLSDWWTLFSANQNNFTVRKWGNRLQIVFNEGLMHNTLKNTALDGTFVIQLAENVTTSLGEFKAFKYEMTPKKTGETWAVEAKSVYTDAEIANANRITANLTNLHLQLCLSLADHNLELVFDNAAFSHDGTVASSGQIGVLSNVKINGKTLNEWYAYNTAGKLDTVLFYPQNGCRKLVMQFKIDRMVTLFGKDPIYYEDVVVSSDELVWEYYDKSDKLTFVTVPAFSYTYSQAHGAFYKTGEVPETTEEPLKVKDVSPISTFREGNDSGHVAGTQVFSIGFWKNVCGSNTSIANLPSYENVWDKVLLNGKTLREIKETATNKSGEAYPSGITVQFMGYGGYDGKRIVIYLKGDLADEFLFTKTSADTVTVKAGFTSKLGDVVAEDVTFEYHYGDFRKALDTSALEYTDLEVSSLSRLQLIGAPNEQGESAATFFIYFDRPVSYERLLYVARPRSSLLDLQKNGTLKVSQEKIYGIFDNHINDYILDYIKYDGKTIRETLAAEDELGMRVCGIDVHYLGDTFDTKAMQLTFHVDANCLITKSKEHTIEIMEGFVSPLLGKTTKSFKFEFVADTNGWKNVTVGASTENYPELPKAQSGCGAVVSVAPIVFAALGAGVLAFRPRRREDDEE